MFERRGRRKWDTMYEKNWMGMALAALFAFTTACQDDHVGPIAASQDLSLQEAADLGVLMVDNVDGILDAEAAAHPSVVAAEQVSAMVSSSAVPVTTTFSFTRERACREGGMVVATGSGTHVADRETGEVTLDYSGSKTVTDCARVRGDVVVTIDGSGTFEGHRHRMDGQFEGLQTHDAAGSFSWVTSDGREGECSYELSAAWDPETATKTISGFVCDKKIDRTVTRDGSAGNDDGDDD